jgi:site-specific DNA-cytosine methylase
MHKVSDLFAGLGGWGCGATQAGCEVVLAADAAKHLVGLMKSNMPKVDAACLTFPCDEVKTRIPLDTTIIFASPPCQTLSAARTGTTDEQRASGLALVQWTLDLLLETLPAQAGRAQFVFCCENVVSTRLAELLAKVKHQHYGSFDYASLQLRDFGVPTDRRRMIFGSKRLIAKLVATKPIAAPSVADALGSKAIGNATHLKNSSSVMDESGVRIPSLRPVTCPGFTVCATHPLLLADSTGATVRCLNAREQAKLMTFPDNWELPAKSRDAVHAVGNSVPPAFSLKATELAIEALEEMAKADEEASKQEEDMEPEKMVDGKQILHKINRIQVQNKRLKRRLESIESTLRKYSLD